VVHRAATVVHRAAMVVAQVVKEATHRAAMAAS
jgi:hypothetical protein